MWLCIDLDPLEYGWEESAQHGIGLVPVQGFDVVCPAIIVSYRRTYPVTV